MLQIRKAISFNEHDVILIPSKDSTFLLYAPTLRKLLRITTDLALRISGIGLFQETDDRDVRAVASLLKQSLKNAIKPFPMHLRKSKFFHLALGLTKDCTLNCLYCHADAGKREDMPIEVLYSSIQYAFETAQKNSLKGINISFAVGGEPTTNWKLFTSCIERIKESETQYGIPVHLSITTNGYYGSNKRQFIAEYFYSILLSLDGPPEIQNLHRPSRAGNESYSIVRDSALFFITNVKSFAIRSTVSNHSVKKMPQIVEFFFKEFGNQYHLVFEPLVPLGRAIINTPLVSEPSQEDFVKYYIQAKELGKTHGLEIRTSAANHKRLVTSFCGAMSIPSFTVTTKGIVTTCERDSEGDYYWYGKFSPESKDFVLEEQRINYNKALLEMPQKCRDCFCKWHCAGDCPDVRSINYDRCYVNRSLIQYELESILNEAKNKVTKGGGKNERSPNESSCLQRGIS